MFYVICDIHRHGCELHLKSSRLQNFSLSNLFVFSCFRRSASVIWTAVSGTEAVIADTKFSGKHLRALEWSLEEGHAVTNCIWIIKEQYWAFLRRRCSRSDDNSCVDRPHWSRSVRLWYTSQRSMGSTLFSKFFLFFLLHHVIVVRLSSTAG